MIFLDPLCHPDDGNLPTLAGGIAYQLAEMSVVCWPKLILDDDRMPLGILGQDVETEVASRNLPTLQIEFVDL